MDSLFKETLLAGTFGVVTFTRQVADLPAQEAVIVAVPALTAVTSPLVTVANSG